MVLPQFLKAGYPERNLVDGGVLCLLWAPRCDGNLVMLDRIAAEKGDIEASPRMSAVGHHQSENSRIEIDHLFKIESIKPNVAKLSVWHGVH